MLSNQQSGVTRLGSCNNSMELDSQIKIIFKQGSIAFPLFIKQKFEGTASSCPYDIDISLELKKVWTSYQADKEQLDVATIPSSIKEEAVNCLNNIYSLNNHNDDAKSLSYLFKAIEEALARHDLLYIDALLSAYDPEKCKPIISTGLLRSTFRAKSNLTAWQLCISRIIKYFDQHNENTKHLLRGLMRANDRITVSTTTLS